MECGGYIIKYVVVISNNYLAVISDKFMAVISNNYVVGISDKYVAVIFNGRRPQKYIYIFVRQFLTIIIALSICLKEPFCN